MQIRSIIPQPPHLARPLGILRFAMLFPIFLLARVPLWFVIIACFLINGTVGYVAMLLISSLIFISRSIVEAEFSAGEDTLSFYLIARIIKYIYYFTIIFLLIVFISYILNLSVDSPSGKVLSLFGVCLLLYLFSLLSRYNNISRDNQNDQTNKSKPFNLFYHIPLPYLLATNFLWFYLAFVPDSFSINIAVLLLIYIIEIYVLYNENPMVVRKGSAIKLNLFDISSFKELLQGFKKSRVKAKEYMNKDKEVEAVNSLNLELSKKEEEPILKSEALGPQAASSIEEKDISSSEEKLEAEKGK